MTTSQKQVVPIYPSMPQKLSQFVGSRLQPLIIIVRHRSHFDTALLLCGSRVDGNGCGSIDFVLNLIDIFQPGYNLWKVWRKLL